MSHCRLLSRGVVRCAVLACGPPGSGRGGGKWSRAAWTGLGRQCPRAGKVRPGWQVEVIYFPSAMSGRALCMQARPSRTDEKEGNAPAKPILCARHLTRVPVLSVPQESYRVGCKRPLFQMRMLRHRGGEVTCPRSHSQ